MTLKKTPARLELLQAVADGAVTQHWPLGGGPAYSVLDHGPTGWASRGLVRRYQRVTAAMRDLRRRELADTPPMAWGGSSSLWHLTDAGRDLLVEWGGTP